MLVGVQVEMVEVYDLDGWQKWGLQAATRAY